METAEQTGKSIVLRAINSLATEIVHRPYHWAFGIVWVAGIYSGSRALSGEYPIEALIITMIAFLGLQGVLLSRENRASAGPE
jgi:hypothetical protein